MLHVSDTRHYFTNSHGISDYYTILQNKKEIFYFYFLHLFSLYVTFIYTYMRTCSLYILFAYDEKIQFTLYAELRTKKKNLGL